MNHIKLIALDLDGTLLDSRNQISETNQSMIRRAVDAGIEVIIATGRGFSALCTDVLEHAGIRYAITNNGAETYYLPDKKRVFQENLPSDLVCSLFRRWEDKDILFDIFSNGAAYSQANKRYLCDKVDVPDYIKEHLRKNRTLVDSIPHFLEVDKAPVQKCTLNFCLQPDGSHLYRDKVFQELSGNPQLNTVCGGFHNLEFTKAGVSKASALKKLLSMLDIPLEAVMACGDSENDLDMIRTAAIGIAMSNADPILLECADHITLSNEEDGVAKAIERFLT